MIMEDTFIKHLTLGFVYITHDEVEKKNYINFSTILGYIFKSLFS